MPMESTATPSGLERLQGKIVLVRSAHDAHHPPTGLRGTIEVRDAEKPAGGQSQVVLTWDIPGMFNTASHRRSITLQREEDVRRLLASERDGTFEFTVDQELD